MIHGVAGARRLRAVERMLHAEPEELRDRQGDLFQGILESALTTTPYRRRYGSAGPRSLEDLRSLPFVDRHFISAFPLEERLATRPDPLVRFATSGTSGHPLEVAWSEEEAAWQAGLLARLRRAHGIPAAGEPFVVDVIRRRRAIQVVVRDRPVDMSVPASPEAMADEIRRTRPDVLMGDPTLLLEVALALDRHPVRGVIAYGEILEPQIRSRLERSFGVPPVDVYGSSEGGFISWECPSGAGYHINADAVVVEIVDEEGRPVPAGTTGELVITNLWNRTCPIVRYRTGDLSRLLPDPCPCGILLPLMGPAEGRTNDWVIAPDGRKISPLRMLLAHPLGTDFREAVRRYRIVQRAVDDFLIQIEWSDGHRADLVEPIAPMYSQLLGGPVTVHVEDVDPMPRPSSGKFRLVESRVSAPGP